MKLLGWLIRFINHTGLDKLKYHLIEFLSLSICLSLVFSIGPISQQYLFSLINSRSTTIYGSAYQDSIVHFPTLLGWLRGTMQWQPLTTGVLVSGFSLRYSSPREFLKAVAVSSFLILALGDITTGVLQKTITSSYIAENLFADFVGSIGVSIIILVVVIGFEFFVRHQNGLNILRRIQGAAFVVASGVGVSCFSFYVFEVFYLPLPDEMDVLLSYPISGAVAFDTTHVDTDKKSTPFQILPTEIGSGTVDWTSPMKPLDVVWKAAGANFIYDAKLELYSNCLTRPNVQVSPHQTQTIDLKNIRNLSMSFSQGMNMLTIGTAESDGNISLTSDDVTLFWIDQDQKNRHQKITQFISKKSELTYNDAGGTIDFYISSPLMTFSNDEVKYASQNLHIRTDKEEYFFKIRPPLQGHDSKSFDCKPLPIAEMFSNGHFDPPSDTSILGILVRITASPKTNIIYDRNSSSLEVKGDESWLDVDNLDEDALASGNPGQVSAIQFQGNIANLELNGSSTDVQPSATYMAVGQLTGRFDTTGQLRFLGTAKALWADGRRLNPTRWETWPLELRRYLMGLFMALGSFILRSAFACLRKNEKFIYF